MSQLRPIRDIHPKSRGLPCKTTAVSRDSRVIPDLALRAAPGHRTASQTDQRRQVVHANPRNPSYVADSVAKYNTQGTIMTLPNKPGRPCRVCADLALRKQVDRAILSGEPIARIARRFVGKVSEDSIHRHSQKHLSRAQLRASIDRADEAEEQHEVALALDARKLRYKAIQLLLAAERAGDLGNAIRAVREARDCLLAEARLSGQLDPPQVNVNVENEAPQVLVVLPSNGRETPEITGTAEDTPAIPFFNGANT
jgi:hypothetical protein